MLTRADKIDRAVAMVRLHLDAGQRQRASDICLSADLGEPTRDPAETNLVDAGIDPHTDHILHSLGVWNVAGLSNVSIAGLLKHSHVGWRRCGELLRVAKIYGVDVALECGESLTEKQRSDLKKAVEHANTLCQDSEPAV